MTRVGNDFDLHPGAAARGLGNAGEAHGLIGSSGARSIGQEAHASGDMRHNSPVLGIHAAHGHGHHFRAARFGHFRDEIIRGVFARAHEKPASEFHAAEYKFIFHVKLLQKKIRAPSWGKRLTTPLPRTARPR